MDLSWVSMDINISLIAEIQSQGDMACFVLGLKWQREKIDSNII